MRNFYFVKKLINESLYELDDVACSHLVPEREMQDQNQVKEGLHPSAPAASRQQKHLILFILVYLKKKKLYAEKKQTCPKMEPVF